MSQPLTDIQHSEILSWIQRNPDAVKWSLPYSVTLTPAEGAHRGSLGIKVVTFKSTLRPKETYTVIRRIDPWCDIRGTISLDVGDRILIVNKEPVTNMSIQSVVTTIKNSVMSGFRRVSLSLSKPEGFLPLDSTEPEDMRVRPSNSYGSLASDKVPCASVNVDSRDYGFQQRVSDLDSDASLSLSSLSFDKGQVNTLTSASTSSSSSSSYWSPDSASGYEKLRSQSLDQLDTDSPEKSKDGKDQNGDVQNDNRVIKDGTSSTYNNDTLRPANIHLAPSISSSFSTSTSSHSATYFGYTEKSRQDSTLSLDTSSGVVSPNSLQGQDSLYSIETVFNSADSSTSSGSEESTKTTAKKCPDVCPTCGSELKPTEEDKVDLASLTLENPLKIVWDDKPRVVNLKKTLGTTSGKLGFTFKTKLVKDKNSNRTIEVYALVETVQEGGAAAGLLQRGDCILSVNGEAISCSSQEDMSGIHHVQRIKKLTESGDDDNVKLVIQRPARVKVTKRGHGSKERGQRSKESTPERDRGCTYTGQSSNHLNCRASSLTARGVGGPGQLESPTAVSSGSYELESLESSSHSEEGRCSDFWTQSDNMMPQSRKGLMNSPRPRKEATLTKGRLVKIHRRQRSDPLRFFTSCSFYSKGRRQTVSETSSIYSVKRKDSSTKTRLFIKRVITKAIRDDMEISPHLRLIVCGNPSDSVARMVLGVNRDVAPSVRHQLYNQYDIAIPRSGAPLRMHCMSEDTTKEFDNQYLAAHMAEKLEQRPAIADHLAILGQKLTHLKWVERGIPVKNIGQCLLEEKPKLVAHVKVMSMKQDSRLARLTSHIVFCKHALYLLTFCVEKYVKSPEDVLCSLQNDLVKIRTYAGSVVPVFLVATVSKDTSISKDLLLKMGSNLEQHFRRAYYSHLVYNKESDLPLFTLCDNTEQSPSAILSDISQLRDRIFTLCIAQPFMKVKYPLGAVVVRNSLYSEGGELVRTLNQLQSAVKDVWQKCTEKDFQMVLEYLHNSGDIIVKNFYPTPLCHSPILDMFVLINQHQLVPIIDKLLTIPPKSEQSPQLRKTWQQLDNTGIVPGEFLHKAIFCNSADFSEHLAFLELMHFIFGTTELSTSGAKQKMYCIPAHLAQFAEPHLPASHEFQEIYLDFNGHLPQPVFLVLLLHFREACLKGQGYCKGQVQGLPQGQGCIQSVVSGMFIGGGFQYSIHLDRLYSLARIFVRPTMKTVQLPDFLDYLRKLLCDFTSLHPVVDLSFQCGPLCPAAECSMKTHSDAPHVLDIFHQSEVPIFCGAEQVDCHEDVKIWLRGSEVLGMSLASPASLVSTTPFGKKVVTLDTRIRDMPYDLWSVICNRLSIPVLGDRDWKGVAGELGKTPMEVSLYEQQRDPCRMLLTDWGNTTHDTVQNLIDILQLPWMERYDVVEDIMGIINGQEKAGMSVKK
ncbi:uncharacterized protein LOC106168013 [Lingula anatina]|uniref:Uncharacterized protein LOC106168013 n=1 Tax=Lingula anatina TaxID=7574 RepID=A0A1S3IW23_LINAN|nr:uncharacterized protein LOC106168013 [Lingula anatina]|eukprot:XP_013402390.2 uncharacterized protein LOC106168013 [Lingula anatina]